MFLSLMAFWQMRDVAWSISLDYLALVSGWMVEVFERSTSDFHRHSSHLQHYRILHNNSVQKIKSLIDVWQRIRNHLPPPKGNVRLLTEGEESTAFYLMSSTDQIHVVSIEKLKNVNDREATTERSEFVLLSQPRRRRMWMKHLGRSHPILASLCPDPT